MQNPWVDSLGVTLQKFHRDHVPDCPAGSRRPRVGKGPPRSSPYTAADPEQGDELDDRAKHLWIATHILPLEAEVRGWLRRHVHTLKTEDADDLLQEAYARLWLIDPSKIENARGYLYAIVRNLLGEHARRARIVPMERLGEIEALRIPSDEPGPERRVSARQELERLERIIETLPERARKAFTLRKFRGLSLKQIAREMDIAEKTVEKHLATALLRVLDALREDERDPRSQTDRGVGAHDARVRKD
jgi:RNA polymerase sigma factor (sigma-70 family)